MLAIKLSRVGKKKQPQYRLIVTERGRDPWGRSLEILGNYNPLATPAQFTIKQERLAHWMKVGAQPTASVHNLLVRQGIVAGDKINKIHQSKKRRARAAAKKK